MFPPASSLVTLRQNMPWSAMELCVYSTHRHETDIDPLIKLSVRQRQFLKMSENSFLDKQNKMWDGW